jgi:hypothetical protein
LQVSDNKHFLVTGEMLDWVLVLDDEARNYPPPGASGTR